MAVSHDRRRSSEKQGAGHAAPLIMVALDGSALAERAIPTAVAIARLTNPQSRIEFVHVHTDGLLSPNAPMIDVQWEDEEAKHMEAGNRVRAERAERESGVSVKAIGLRGPAAPSLLRHAVDRGANLVVLTTHGRSGFSRAWFGSVAEEVIHAAQIAVLVVRSGEYPHADVSDPIFDHVLIPIDHAESGPEALRHALALGTGGRTTYTLLTIVAPITVLPPPFLDPGVFIAEDDSARRTVRATDTLELIAEDARATGATIDVRVLVGGSVATTILEIAAQSAADLIVFPTRPRGHLSRAFLGSIADKVVRGATVSILLFPVSEEQRHST